MSNSELFFKRGALTVLGRLQSTLTAVALVGLSSIAQAADEVYFIHNDHLGTSQVITDASQQVVWAADYEPFGRATVTTEAISNNLRLPGQYYDSETGLHYNYFRDYDPSTGRYIESDPIGLLGAQLLILTTLDPELPFGHDINPYVYASNNPLYWIDSSGLWSITFGGYLGSGWQISFGRDPNTGGGFLTGRLGFGLGGGIVWDLNGGRPGSSELDECSTGGIGAGGFGDTGFNAGPLNAGLNTSGGVNFDNNGDINPYFDPLTPSWSIGDSWGIHAGGAIGGEVTIYSPGSSARNY